MKKLICLSGKQYSGKDTLAKIILDSFRDFVRIGIGDAIKIEYGKRHNLSYEEIESNKGKYRTGLIELGDWGRSIDPDFWLKKIIESDKNVVVTDVRLLHEAEVFKSAGAFLIRVEASFNVRSKRGIITNANDLTETALDNYKGFDYFIENNMDYDTLVQNSKSLITLLRTRFS